MDVIALVQLGDDADWTLLDLPNNPTAWTSLSPSATVKSINVQGVILEGYGRYTIEAADFGGIMVNAWTEAGVVVSGETWTFYPLSPDLDLGGAVNTDQVRVVYPTGFPVPLTPSLKGSLPTAAQLASRSLWGWRNFCQHLDPSEFIIVDGKPELLEQRAQGRYKPLGGTRTYYQSLTDRAHGSFVFSHEKALDLAPDVSGEIFVNVAASSALESFAFLTANGGGSALNNEPGYAAPWTDAPITTRAQLDCTAAGANISYGLRGITILLDTANGQFRRVTSGTNANVQGAAQAEAAFTGTGLKLATDAGFAVGAGHAADDLYAIHVATGNSNVLNAQQIIIRVGTSDSFADGSWPPKQVYADLRSMGVGY